MPDQRAPRSSRRVVRPSGDPDLDARLQEFVANLDPTDQRITLEALGTLLQLSHEGVSRLDRKIANTALKEMRHAFNMFAPFRGTRKVTIFGSARTSKEHAEYEATKDFARRISAEGWMVVTGAGPGIMEAGHEGAAAENSIGVNILLPFEAKPNPVIADNPKLINFKYFFTRKLMFIKESDGFLLAPGGFGTLDETFELLTLIQTGKSDLHPIVMMDAPGGDYWLGFESFLKKELLRRGFVDEADFSLFRMTDSPEEAVKEIMHFYRVYHSERYVGDHLVLRLNIAPGEHELKELSAEFADLLDGPIQTVEASPAERRDDDVPDLPRIALSFDRQRTGRLRLLIDRLNDLAEQ
ncbi:MAG: LOG family protein [Actinomycetota bacterium]